MTGSSQELARPRRRVPLVLKILGAVLGVVVLAAVVLAFAAESIINNRKDKILADVAQKIGRPVSAGKIGVSLLGGRFEVNDVAIGRDPGIPEEPDPALSLGLMRVNVKLWPVIASLGKKAVVQQITVERFNAAVVRLADGTLNWQRVAERLDTGEKPDDKPIDDETRARVRAARIDKIRMDDIAVRFIDLETKGATVAISDLDVALDDVSLESAFALKVTAAILGNGKNFDLDARFGAARDVPGTIEPPPLEQASIKLSPTNLAPLAPFLAALSEGGSKPRPRKGSPKTDPGVSALRELTEGQLAMDLALGAGAAVPGGKGPTNFRGFVALTGLKFAGGDKFDARVDSDVEAQVPEGVAQTVDIRRFTAKLGDMAIEAKGKLSDLETSPRVDGFTVGSRGLDFTRLHAYYPPLDKTAGAVLRGPFSLEARGSASEGRQRLVAKLDLTPASIEVPGQFRKPNGTPLTLSAEVGARPNLVELERAALTLAALTLNAKGTLRMEGTGARAKRSFTGEADIPPVAARDLVAIFAPKQLADVPAVKLGAKIQASGTVGRDETMKVNVPSFTLTGGRSDLAGAMSLENLAAPKISFDGRSKFLDVDDFLPPSAKDKGKAKDAGAAKDAKAAGKGKEELPPQLQALEGAVKLVVDNGRAAEINYQALKADLNVKNGRLSARTLEVDTLGGHFSGAGTELPLADPEGGFVARGQVTNLDIAAVLDRFAKERNFLNGRLSGKVDLKGEGTEVDILKATLAGMLSGRIENAELLTTSLLAPIAEALERASGAPLVSRYLKGASERVAKLKDRRLGKVGGIVHFANGAMELAKPLEAATPSGPLSLTGRVQLGGAADLVGEWKLSPDVANALTGGKARFDGPVPIALKIEGPITAPRVRPADQTKLIKVFAAALAKGEGGRLVGEKVQQVMDTPAAQQAKAEVEAARARATAETDRAKAEAAEQAERARLEAEERARKAREEAERRAKEAAGKGLRGILGR